MAGEAPLDRRTAYALGVALGTWAQKAAAARGESVSHVLIGMDTRESGPWLASAVAGGLKHVGITPRFAGVITMTATSHSHECRAYQGI